MSYRGNIIVETIENHNFRKVLFTGHKSQLVVMDIPPNEEVGLESHEHVEQTLFFLSGTCKCILNGEEHITSAGDVVIVTPGMQHNFINIGEEPLKIYTVYAPANHIDGKIHATKKDADEDEADEAVGHSYTS